MNINIFGSTGVIGTKSLKIIKDQFPKLKINLLCANTNYKLLYKQICNFEPKYAYINDKSKYNLLKLKVKNKTKILTFEELISHLDNSKSNYTILSISGYKSLYYLVHIR